MEFVGVTDAVFVAVLDAVPEAETVCVCVRLLDADPLEVDVNEAVLDAVAVAEAVMEEVMVAEAVLEGVPDPDCVIVAEAEAV